MRMTMWIVTLLASMLINVSAMAGESVSEEDVVAAEMSVYQIAGIELATAREGSQDAELVGMLQEMEHLVNRIKYSVEEYETTLLPRVQTEQEQGRHLASGELRDRICALAVRVNEDVIALAVLANHYEYKAVVLKDSPSLKIVVGEVVIDASRVNYYVASISLREEMQSVI